AFDLDFRLLQKPIQNPPGKRTVSAATLQCKVDEKGTVVRFRGRHGMQSRALQAVASLPATSDHAIRSIGPRGRPAPKVARRFYGDLVPDECVREAGVIRPDITGQPH